MTEKTALSYFLNRVTFDDAYARSHGDTEEERKEMAYQILAALSELEKNPKFWDLVGGTA